MKFKTSIIATAIFGLTLSVPAIASTVRGVDDSGKSFLFFKKKNRNASLHSDAESGSEASATSSYDKIRTDSATVSDGMFTVIHNGDDYFFEIPRNLIGRDMLIVNKLVRVPKELNEAGINRGINTSNRMVRFELDNKSRNVIIREARVRPSAPAGDAIATSVADNYIDPIIASLPIETFNPDSSAVVIKANDLYNGSSDTFADIFADINLGTSTSKDLSRIKSLKAFDNNIYAISELTTKVVEPQGSVYITVELGSSLVLLPEKPMPGRYASSRVGYFTEGRTRYSDSQQRVSRENFITRWRLEPRPEDVDDYLAGRLVEPAKPITFYIDNSAPAKWRPYIRQGILDWQKAFEMAGFKNAIRVEELGEGQTPDDNDIDYSVLTYAASRRSNAMGPSITDPRSGEIIEADIVWWHNVIDIIRDWLVVQTGAVDPRVRQPIIPDDLMGDAMRFVACHEVGHSLGLAHNMMASAAIPTDSLRSQSFTDWLNGTSASIMDYARFNYVAQPGDGVRKLSPNLGPYDMLAIEYGYRWYPDSTPESEYMHLQELLSQYDHPFYRFSVPPSERNQVDPRALTEDLGDDNIKSSRLGIANLKRIAPRILDWTCTGEPGQNYDEASNLYSSVIGQWNRYLYHVLANIGGIYIDNTYMGEGRHSYINVEKERQREAVKLLVDEVFTYPSWLFDADVVNYTYIVQNTPVGRIEMSPSLILSTYQSYLLWDLLSNDRLVRMLENEARNGDKAFTPIELTDMLHNGIFRSTIRGTVPDVRERAIQKNYIDALIIAACEKQGVKEGVALTSDLNAGGEDDPAMKWVKSSLRGHDCSLCGHHNSLSGEQKPTPRNLNFYSSQSNRISDAISVKRGELMRVRSLLKRRLSTTDTAARYHYTDLLMRINTALGLPIE